MTTKLLQRKTNRLFLLLLAVCMVFSACPAHAQALSTEERVVRVAYPLQPGVTDIDEHGNYTGYTYEYLEEIAQYTGWNYEFIQLPGTLDENLFTMMEMVKNGEVDLMGAMVYSDELGKQFDYATYSYGSGETVLQTLYDSPLDTTINSQVQQTFRIAVLGEGSVRERELESFCEINLITPEYVRCATEEGQMQALRDGRADMMLNASMNYMDGVRTVARFAPKPFYFVTAKGNDTGLMEELNAAILSIEQADPAFPTKLYEKYFSPPNDTLYLSESETAYVENAGTLKVGALTGQPPYQYQDENGRLTGISIDLLTYISEHTGLRFEFITAASLEELYELARAGKIDMMAGIPYDYDFAREHDVSMAQPYISSQYLIMMNETASEESIRGKRLALLSSSTYRGEFVGQVVPFETISDCIHAVVGGKADYTYVDAYTAQYYTNLPQYKNLKLVPQTYDPRRVCFGVVKPGSRDLLSILNKINTTISEVDMQSIINQNITKKPPSSLGDFVLEYPVESMTVILIVAIAIIAILLIFLRQRAKMNKKNALELKKHFRVYALMNEYFFEYNYSTDVMIVSTPPKETEKQPDLLEFDFKKPVGEREDERRAFLGIIRSGKDGIHEARLLCIDDRRHWLRIALETVYDNDTPAYAIGKINIIDEEVREKETLLEKSQHDSLTHIYNAETSFTLAKEALESLKGGETGALLLIDIDRFKSINDTYGHLQGDEMLRRTANLLQSSFREEDIVGRPGGDEFMVYMKSVRDSGVLADKCAYLCAKAHEIFVAPERHLTFSIGAVIAVPGTNYDELYRLADHALYQAKEQGRDSFRLAGLAE